MATPTFIDILQQLADGQPVNAASVNTPINILQQNLQTLRDLLELGLTGQALIAQGVPVETGALVGQAVYYNPLTLQFERAIAAVTNDPTTQALIMGQSSNVWGIIQTKPTATSANLLIAGMAPVDLTLSFGAGAPAGQYYLSATTPGGLTNVQPSASVPVLRCDGQGNVLVNPQTRDLLETHKHFKFPLRCFPAGGVTPPAPGGRHTVNVPNNAIEGWLPASDPIFNGTAPSVAVFGYNWKKSSFAPLWPPFPLQGVYLEFDRAEDAKQGFHGVPLGTQGLCYINAHGIWWTSNCYGDVPWPTTLTTAQEASLMSPDSDVAECPRDLRMGMNLYFTAPVFQNNNTVVTNLIAGPTSPLLKISCQGTGVPASTGPLQLDLNLQFLTGSLVKQGFLACKDINGETLDFGPVIEGIRSLTNTLTIAGTTTRPAIVGDANQTAYAQGLLDLNVNLQVGGTELPVELDRLAGVVESFYQNIPSLGFPVGKASNYRGRIYVPVFNVPTSGVELKIRMRLLGRAAGTLPQLTFAYRRIPRPTAGAAVPVQLPTTDTTVVIATSAAIAIDQYVEFETPFFNVAAGDLVVFQLGRNASDGYSGDVLLLNQLGILGP